MGRTEARTHLREARHPGHTPDGTSPLEILHVREAGAGGPGQSASTGPSPRMTGLAVGVVPA
ncbi:hypothetical protein [Actinomadura spongiicola]|nr:hypothetical protein [Actinomadura spongiicola]